MYKKRVIRFWKRGHKNYTLFLIVVTDKHQRQRGKIIDKIGYFNPNLTERTLHIDGERLAFWLNRGVELHPKLTNCLYLLPTAIEYEQPDY